MSSVVPLSQTSLAPAAAPPVAAPPADKKAKMEDVSGGFSLEAGLPSAPSKVEQQDHTPFSLLLAGQISVLSVPRCSVVFEEEEEDDEQNYTDIESCLCWLLQDAGAGCPPADKKAKREKASEAGPATKADPKPKTAEVSFPRVDKTLCD